MKQFFANIISFVLPILANVSGQARILRGVGWLCRGGYVKSRYGVFMRADFEDKTNLWAILGWYESVAKEIRSIKPGTAFIDIGANAGVFSLMASQRVGSNGIVLAFEPQKDIFSTLVANCNKNNIQNVYCFNLAISDTTKQVSLNATDSKHTGTAFISEDPTSSAPKAWAVSPAAEFSLLGSMLMNKETTIKIDVEGHELSVLRGISSLLEKTTIWKLIVEIDHALLHRFGTKSEEIYIFLKKFGFEPTSTTPSTTSHYDEVFVRTKPS